MLCKNMQNDGEVQRETPLEWTYVFLGKKLCQNWMWVVKMEVREREAPLWNIPTEAYVYLSPL